MPPWLWIILALVETIALLLLVRGLWQAMFTKIALARYPGGIELGGVACGGQTTYRILQWLADPDDPQPCPLALHLPGGDLTGDALCDLNATVDARKRGAPQELEVFPFHKFGKIIGISIRLIPEGPPGVRPVTVSVAGIRLQLPLSGEEATLLLGEPLHQHKA
jgi:hypothetical protein